MIYSDKKLSQRLERAEATFNANFVETRAKYAPEIGAQWIDVNGTYALYDGVDSPATQTFGLGLFNNVNHEDLDQIEAFFKQRNAPVFHEVSPMADPEIMLFLNSRGYHPIELTSIMYKPLDHSVNSNTNINPLITTRVISSDEADLWAKIVSEGWATEMPDGGKMMLEFAKISARCSGAAPYLAEFDGKAIATGMLFICEDIAVLAGASTVPEGRNKGAQNALLHARLNHAAQQGCTLAFMAALPGSQSQKNAQKNGFKIAYTRTKWQL